MTYSKDRYMKYNPTLRSTIYVALPVPEQLYTLFWLRPCTQLTNTKHICVSGGKTAQDVGMV